MNGFRFMDGSLDPSAALSGSYNLWLVGFSYLIAVLAAYASLTLSNRVSNSPSWLGRCVWQIIGSVAMGFGIWAMHFLGMLAFSLPVPVAYDPWLTAFSVIPAVVAGLVMIRVVDRRSVSTRIILLGGVLMGGGIGAMHFMGMAAMRMQALMLYDPTRFVISILIAVLLATVALSVKRIALAYSFPVFVREPGSALVMGLAVTGMHYTALWATFFFGEVEAGSHDAGISNFVLAYTVGIITILVLITAISSAVFDQRLGHAKKALKRSEHRLRAILEHLPDGVITIDAEARIQSFNSAAEKLFGFSAEECLGRNVSMLMTAQDSETHDAQVQEYLEGGPPKIIGIGREVTGRRNDGSTFPMFLKTDVLEIQAQRFFVGVVRDITSQKAAETELKAHRTLLQEALNERSRELLDTVRSLEKEVGERRRAEQEARNANRSKSEFLANMSHELRTPLNAILGFSEIISKRLFGDAAIDRYSEYAADILTSGRYLLDIINDILDLAKIEAGKMKLDECKIDPVRLVESCVQLTIETAISFGLNLSARHDHEALKIIGDQRKLQQILINLLANAIKFTKTGGKITLQTSIRKNGQFIFEIKDTGIGIAECDIPKILSPFGQVDSSLARETHGTGLGLPLVKSLVELHGGRLAIESVVGEGTIVRVSLPASRVERCSSVPSEVSVSTLNLKLRPTARRR